MRDPQPVWLGLPQLAPMLIPIAWNPEKCAIGCSRQLHTLLPRIPCHSLVPELWTEQICTPRF